MDLVLILLLGVVMVAVFVGLFVWAHGRTVERRRIWAEVAKKRGGRYFEPRYGLFRSHSEGFDVRVGHAIVRIDLYVVSTGKSSTTYTRARARYATGDGALFTVYEEGFFSSLGKALGTQDLELGDPAFDEVFMVKGDDVDAIRESWTPQARAMALSTLRNARVESDGAEVKILVLGAIADAAILHALMDLATELASIGARELDAIGALPDATLDPVGGTWEEPTPPRVRIATDAGEVVATVRTGRGAARLSMSLASDRDLPAFSADVRDGGMTGLPKGVLTERAAGVLGALDGATLSSDGARARLAWPDVPSPEAVPAGATLLSEVAGGSRSAGAFR